MKTDVRHMATSMWWLLLLQGIVAVIVGLLMVSSPAATLAVIALYIGVYLLISGFLVFVRLFTIPSSWLWAWFNGILGVLAGLFLLRHSLSSAVLVPQTLVTVLVIQAVVMGGIDLVRGFEGHGRGVFILGVPDGLIGLWLLVHPIATVWGVPEVLGVLDIVGGLVAVCWALCLQRQAHQVSQALNEPA